MLDKLAQFLGGSIFKEIKSTAMAYFPPEVSPLQKAEFELQLTELLNNKQRDADAAVAEMTKQFNDRIISLEGTTTDLKTIRFLGPLVIFLRGVQRPAWGFVTMYFDFQWFAAATTYTEQQQTALIGINLLVLVFLFGERAVKNVLPFVTKYMESKNAGS